MTSTLLLKPGSTSLAQLHQIYRQDQHQDFDISIDTRCQASVEAAAQVVADAAANSNAVYGINTGFGKLANTRIPADKTSQLQRNLILSHCCGVGEPLPRSVVRLIIVMKMISLGRGASGVRWQLIETLQRLLQLDLLPLIPAQGSVGASGDLAPLAHLTAAMIGVGRVFYRGQLMTAAAALQRAGLTPLELGPKEGLAMINGSQVSTALALAGLFDAWDIALTGMVSGAMTTDALMGSTQPFRAEIHALRGLPGQIDVASGLRALLDGSAIRDSHREDDDRVQDPYSIRCQPQVMGACVDQFRQVAQMLEIEANAVTDNPIIISSAALILSGGNFHAEPVAFGADQCALAIAEIGSITERRIATTVDPAQNYGLPAFVSPDPGLNSGFMVAEVTAAALMAENKHRATPCSIDSTPTSANQEDHVSMACHGAQRLTAMNENLAYIIAIELLIAVQAVEFRAPLLTSKRLQRVMQQIRNAVPALGEDRYLADDIATAQQMVASGAIIDALNERELLPQLKP